jgi:hypothetical protein
VLQMRRKATERSKNYLRARTHLQVQPAPRAVPITVTFGPAAVRSESLVCHGGKLPEHEPWSDAAAVTRALQLLGSGGISESG